MTHRSGRSGAGQPGCMLPGEIQFAVGCFRAGRWVTITSVQKIKSLLTEFADLKTGYVEESTPTLKTEEVENTVLKAENKQNRNSLDEVSETKTPVSEKQSETLNTKVQENSTQATRNNGSKLENPVCDMQTNISVVEVENSNRADSTLITSFQISTNIQNEDVNATILEQSPNLSEAEFENLVENEDTSVENEATISQIEIIYPEKQKTRTNFRRVLFLNDNFGQMKVLRKNQGASTAYVLVNPGLNTDPLPESVVGVDNWIVSSAIMVTLCHQNHFVVLHVVKSCHQGSRILGTFTGGLCSAALSTSKRRPKSRYHSHHAPILPTRFTLLFYPTGEKNYFVESKKPTFFSSFLPSYVF